MPAKIPKTPPRELVTILDFVRYAASRFAEAKLAFGQGTRDAVEDAMFLVCEALRLPKDNAEAFLAARLTGPERASRLWADREARPHAHALPRISSSARICRTTRSPSTSARSCRARISPSYSTATCSWAGAAHRPHGGRAACSIFAPARDALRFSPATSFQNAQVDAVDVSRDALAVAAINIAEHGLVGSRALMRGDLFKPVGDAVYDVILCNPPYVDAQGMARLPKEYQREPRLALAAGADGLDIVRRILAEARAHLSEDGGLLCEIGRCRPALEASLPETNFLWLDTAESSGEVFWLPTAALE